MATRLRFPLFLMILVGFHVAAGCSSSTNGPVVLPGDAKAEADGSATTDMRPWTDLLPPDDLLRPPGDIAQQDTLDANGPDADGGPVQDATPDLPAEGSEVGKPCLSHEDCASGYCIETGAGTVCTVTCVEECPEDWVCHGIPIFGPDPVFLCVPLYWSICEPCTDDTDCEIDSGLCVDTGTEGLRCSLPCASDTDCPGGFNCQEAGFCLPTTGSCRCRKGAEGEQQECLLVNEHGSCPGTQSCLGTDGWGPCGGQPPLPEACDGEDNDCDGEVDEGFEDLDGDLSADCVDPDDDGDGKLDGADNCPLVHNPEQADLDGDGEGDPCDEDDDNDGAPDLTDNCPAHPNPGQLDLDEDGAGDACDEDDDGDGIPDLTDNCPLAPNPLQEDLDDDGFGDDCDADDDNDSLPDDEDNCPQVANTGQENCDGDGLGDVCDPDDDGDGAPDETDCGACDASVYPGATEACNGVDDNCNSLVDEGAAAECHPYSCGGTEGCLNACTDPAHCAPGFFCDSQDHDGDSLTNECLEKLPSGAVCAAGFECADGYCGNGFCCGAVGELCCTTDGDCASLNTVPVCDAPGSCTGHRMAASCNASNVCKATQVADHGGCLGSLCYSGNHCVGAAVYQHKYCDGAGSCSGNGMLVQNCQGINPCCTYGCAGGACTAVFNGTIECAYLCWTNPIMCLCV